MFFVFNRNKLNIKQSINFIGQAWEQIEKQTIINCWNATGILPRTTNPLINFQVARQTLGTLVNNIPNNQPTIIIEDLRNYLESNEDEIIATEETLTDKQIVELIQTPTPISIMDDEDSDEEVLSLVTIKKAKIGLDDFILFCEQQPIDEIEFEVSLEDLQIFRKYAIKLKEKELSSIDAECMREKRFK